MPRPLIIFSQSDYLIHVVDKIHILTNSAEQDLMASSDTDLDLHFLQRRGISGFIMANKTTNNNKILAF